ncbi:MAG: hypothetical protein INH41_03565 [Myxococcaceae bacterium]|jgi:hypothetical protein|nr:hypothetical protein [Myxococcaceae bacterium]
MVCAVCGSASEHETFRPGCGAERPPAREPTPAPPLAHAPAPDVDLTAPRCPQHPDIGASATCLRCGRFVCARCTPLALQQPRLTCEACVRQLEQAKRPAQLRALGLQLVVSWLLVALAMAVTLTGLVLLAGGDASRRLGALLLLGPALVALVLCTALFAVTRRPWVGWVATVTEVFLLVPLWFTNPSLCTAVLAAAPVFSAVRLLQLRELELGLGLGLGRPTS